MVNFKSFFHKYLQLNKIQKYLICAVFLFFTYCFLSLFLFRYFPNSNISIFTKPFSQRFTDFFEVNHGVIANGGSMLNSYVSPFNSSYPPLALLMAIPFALINRHQYTANEYIYARNNNIAVYLVYFLLTLAIFYFVIYKYLEKNLNKRYSKPLIAFITFLLIIFSAPLIHLFDRGNYLIISVIFITLFAFNYEKRPILAAIFLALASCLKIYPLIIFVIYLIDKKYYSLIIGLISGLLITLASFLFFKRGILFNLQAFLDNLASFANYKISVPKFLRALDVQIKMPFMTMALYKIIFYILFFIGLFFGIYYVYLEKVLWKRFYVIIGASLFMKFPVFLYTAMFMVPILILFLLEKDKEKKHIFGEDDLFIFIFICIFIPIIPFAFEPTANGSVFPLAGTIGYAYLIFTKRKEMKFFKKRKEVKADEAVL